ncbi:MAG: DUF721 domain-containing protein [Acidobacteriota bacterium]
MMKDLTRLLPALFQPWLHQTELRENLITSFWKQIMGEALAQKVRPVRLHQSTLIVAVPSHLWKREVLKLRGEIRNRVNGAIGQALIRGVEVRVQQEPDRPRPAQATSAQTVRQEIALPLDSIQDADLSRQLAAAASSYFNRPK